jgi:hypothetical protein
MNNIVLLIKNEFDSPKYKYPNYQDSDIKIHNSTSSNNILQPHKTASLWGRASRPPRSNIIIAVY